MSQKLTKYKLVNADGLKSFRTTKGTFKIETLTDEQAEIIHSMGSPYIEKIEEPAQEQAKAPKK